MGRGQNKQVGNQGEELAARFLLSRGFEIVERNYRGNRGEIDIVARDGDTLVFVEVKTARSREFGSPETWVTERKQRQIEQVAEFYLAEHETGEVECRFDVVALTRKRGGYDIQHIEDAFWL